MLAFACICLRFGLRVCLHLSAFVCICFRLLACAYPPLCRAPLCVTLNSVLASDCRAQFGRPSTRRGCRICVTVRLRDHLLASKCEYPFSVTTLFKVPEYLCGSTDNIPLLLRNPKEALKKSRGPGPQKSSKNLQRQKMINYHANTKLYLHNSKRLKIGKGIGKAAVIN